MVKAPTRTRLSRADRRNQLLDSAEQILLDKGAAAVTMERLAETAGVSKALPYSHFDNADAVLVAVYERTVFELGRRLVESLEAVGPVVERRQQTTALVRSYLDAVRDIGPILGLVTAPGSRTSELGDPDQRVGVRFLTDVLMAHFAVREQRARLIAPIMLSVATGSVGAWVDGDGDRSDIEEVMVDLFETAMG